MANIKYLIFCTLIVLLNIRYIYGYENNKKNKNICCEDCYIVNSYDNTLKIESIVFKNIKI